MKKLILPFLIFLGVGSIKAQHCSDPSLPSVCSPTTSPSNPAGFYPDDASQNCFVKNQSGTANVEFVIPATISILGNNVTVNSIVITDIVNLPPGLCWKSNSASETWSGGTAGCLTISGTPTAPGQYKMKVYGTASTNLGNFSGELDSLLSSFSITGFNYYWRVKNCDADACPAVDNSQPIVSQVGYTSGPCSSGSDAFVQLIHNSADPLNNVVDIYINGTLTYNDFAFRQATNFQTVPAGISFPIAVAPGSSTSVADAFWSGTVGPLTLGQSYIAIAQGVRNPANFDATQNPGNIGFDIKVKANALQQAAVPGTVSVMWWQGVTDAAATIVNTSALGNPIFAARPYAAVDSGYNTIPAAWFAHIPSAGGAITPTGWVGDYQADAGKSAVLFASGFRNPANNQNGPAYSLFLAYPTGTVVELPIRYISKLQVIHNAADSSLGVADIYLNGRKAIPNFAFRTATSFLPVTANFPYNVALAPGGSTSVGQAVYSENIGSLMADSIYAAMAVGVVNSANYAPNPDGVNTGLDVLLIPGVKEVASVSTNTDLKVVHGATDVPTVDLTYPGGSPIVINDLTYKEASNLLSIPSMDIPGELRSSDGTIPYACIQLNLAQAQGAGAIIFASGFFTPASNQNGPAIGIYMAKSNSQVVNLPMALGPCTYIGENENTMNVSMYPNPASTVINIDFESTSNSEVTTQIFDLSGKLISVYSQSVNSGFNSVKMDVSTLQSGMYLLKVQEGTSSITTRFTVNR